MFSFARQGVFFHSSRGEDWSGFGQVFFSILDTKRNINFSVIDIIVRNNYIYLRCY